MNLATFHTPHFQRQPEEVKVRMVPPNISHWRRVMYTPTQPLWERMSLQERENYIRALRLRSEHLDRVQWWGIHRCHVLVSVGVALTCTAINVALLVRYLTGARS